MLRSPKGVVRIQGNTIVSPRLSANPSPATSLCNGCRSLSVLKGKNELATKEELVEWIKIRIEQLEEELRMLRSMLARLEPGVVEEEDFDPNEKIEEIKVRRKVIAKIGIGEDYVRAIFKFEASLLDDIRKYIESIVEEVSDKQAKEGVPAEEQASLIVKNTPDGHIKEIRVINVYTPLEKVKAKAALKYAVQLLYDIAKRKKEE